MASFLERYISRNAFPSRQDRRTDLSIRVSDVRFGTNVSFVFGLNVRPWKARRKVGSVHAEVKQSAVSPPSADQSAHSSELLDCVVVGGGISGLCTAQALLTEHSDTVSNILVTEARDRTGGNITTVEDGGYLWEEGPNSFQPNDSILKCAVDCGLKDELVLADPKSPRYVLWGGRLRPVPAGLLDLPVFDLLSPLGKLRAGFGALGLRPPPPGKEETVEEFVRRNLGAEVFERLIEPFCSGVYAGNPSVLSMKAAFGKVWRLEELGGSIIGGSIKLIQEAKKNPKPPRDPRLPKPKGQTVGSFRKGLITLPNAIAKLLGDKVKVNWKLSQISKIPNGLKLTYDTPSGKVDIFTKSVVLTVPSYVAADLIRPLAPEAASSLDKFYYPPVAAVTISYPRSSIKPERLTNGELFGFGQLHPRSQGVQTLGTIYSSSLFPGRCPDDRVLLLNYIGGSLNTDIVSKSEDEIVSIIDKDLKKMLIREDAEYPSLHGLRLWSRAIPQFNVGHLELLQSARDGIKTNNLDNIVLSGNYVLGVALGRCVEGAYETASQVVEKIKSQKLSFT